MSAVEVHVEGEWCKLPAHSSLSPDDAFAQGAYYASHFEVEHPQLGPVTVVPRSLPIRLNPLRLQEPVEVIF